MEKTESYLHTTISETTIDLDIDIRFLNSRIYTTSDLSSICKISEPKAGIKYLCISTEIVLNECVVVADIKVKPRFLLIVNILTFLTKSAFNPHDFTITKTTNGNIQEVENKKFTFNNTDYIDEFEKIITLINSNKENKKKLFYVIIERYRKTLYADKDIESWGATDTF